MRTQTRSKRKPVFSIESLEPRQVLSTLFVSPTGNDKGLGTLESPYLTIQKAANVAVAGDMVDVQAGQYSGFVLGWDTPKSGTPSAPIVFHGEDGAIINRKNPKTQDGINLEGSSWITIDGFKVTGVNRAGIRSTGGDHVVIQNNVCDQNGRWGIYSSFSTNMVIQNNVASNSRKEHGIYVSNSAVNPSVLNNVVFGNRGSGIHMNGDATQGGSGVITGALIEGNIIYNNGFRGGSAINLDGVKDSVIRNNLLFNNHHSGISLFQIDAAQASTNDLVINNTIVMAPDTKSGSALNIQNGSTGTRAFNNVLLTTSTRNRIGLNLSASSTGGFVSDNNILSPSLTVDGGTHELTLANWTALTGNDVHSKVSTAATVGFVDFALNDFHLTDPSMAGIGSQMLPSTSPVGFTPARAPLMILNANKTPLRLTA